MFSCNDLGLQHDEYVCPDPCGLNEHLFGLAACNLRFKKPGWFHVSCCVTII